MKSFSLPLLIAIACSGTLASADSSQTDCFDADYIKSTLIKVAEWQLQHLPPRHQPLGAANGVFHTGLVAAYQATGNEGLLKAVSDMGEANQWKPGPKLMFPDHHIILNPYIELYRLRKELRMIQPARKFAEAYLQSPANDTRNKLITWWLCDYVFMDAPVLIKLGHIMKRPALLKTNDRLWRECYDLLFDEQQDLFDVSPKNAIYKGFNGPDPGEREANGEKIFWGCGNGWVLGGLALMLKELPADYPQRPHYGAVFKRMALRLAALQHADGTWGASLLDPQSYPNPESTGSSLITFGMAYGVNAGLLPRTEFEPIVKKAWTGLCTICLQPDFRVGWSEGTTAKPIRTYGRDSYHLFSTGVFLLAGSEVSKWRATDPKHQ
jgi:rhamnogalacturonyl hydrolase YesR